MAISYIGLGSNIGNRESNCFQAIDLIKSNLGTVEARSSLYETKPWGIMEQPAFINMAIKLETSLEPLALLKELKKIEHIVGREKTFRWGPRVIDLDILFYDDLIIRTSELVIPHLDVPVRLFVLKPMVEIAPDLIHPQFKKTIQELYKEAIYNESQSL